MIAIRNVEILSPIRSPFNEEYRFRITFECVSPLEDGKSFMLSPSPTRPHATQRHRRCEGLYKVLNPSIWSQLNPGVVA